MMTMLIPKVETYAGDPCMQLNDFFQTFRQRKTVKSFNALSGTSFSTEKGIHYYIPPQAFVNRWGKPIDETIHLEVTEYNTKKDYFFSEQSTLSDARLLDMDFILDLRLKPETRVGVFLRKPIECTAIISKTGRTANYQLFQESNAATKSISVLEAKEWQPSQIAVLIQKHSPKSKVARFLIPSEGAFGLGRIIDRSKKPKQHAMFTVLLDDSVPTLEDSAAYLIFHESNTVVRLQEQRRRFSAFHLPSGKMASLVVIGSKKGRFYFHRSTIPKISSQLIKVNLDNCSLEQLSLRLHKMNY